MAYDFGGFKKRVAGVEDWLVNEFSGIRTGRATAALLDGVLVDSYGTKTALKHIANIAVEDARSLKITPWDNTMIKGIETAIAASNLGVSTTPDASGVRVIFPDLTSERRAQLIKLVGQKREEARVSLRKERETVWEDIQTKEQAKTISQDEKFKYKDDLQKLVDEANQKLDSSAKKKETEIAS